MPQGWPWSMWFLAIALVVAVLQRFPIPGIFLMAVAAMFWSIILVNAGMIGIAWEVLIGRVGKAWLILPLVYFGGYYLAVGLERIILRGVSAELIAFNAGKGLAFDPDRHDLVLENGKGDLNLSVQSLLIQFALPRGFERDQVYFLGTKDACTLAGSDYYRPAGVGAWGGSFAGWARNDKSAADFCMIHAPGCPERPVVRVVSDQSNERRGLLPLRVASYQLRDEISGAVCDVRSIRVSLLSLFPKPVIGGWLNSGKASWEFSAGFARSRPQLLPTFTKGKQESSEAEILGRALGLAPSQDLAARAFGVDAVKGIADAADRDSIARETAVLEAMLSDPRVHQRNGWFRHLTSRPEVVTPYAGRIFAALGELQHSDLRGSEAGRNLWRLAAALPEAELAPFWSKVIEWLGPARAKSWTVKTDEIYARLDGAVPAERAILLHRLESQQGDLQTDLLTSFCRMGTSAPAEVKQRLLGIWQARTPELTKRKAQRGQSDVRLYFTLARLGLKEQAGQVVQQYQGSTFAAIWSEVAADTHGELCDASRHDLTNHFRRR